MAHRLELGLVLDLAFAGFMAVTDAEGNPLASRWRPPGERYDDIAEWIQNALTEAGGTFSDLTRISVGVGPGSFTGIRIAMAFAQGLAMARGAKLHGFTSFAPLLLSAVAPLGRQGASRPEERRLAVIPANTGRFYVASSLQDPGALMDVDGFRRIANPETMLEVHGLTASLDPLLAYFPRVHAMEDRWNVPAIVKYAQTSPRDTVHPYYLQLSAAEAKASGST